MENIKLILKYFPDLTEKQISQFSQLEKLYGEWNEKINVISRKDTENFMERHGLHSLAIAKVMSFNKGSRVLDIGTGGGFPGIPLAILFPDCNFLLVDSIGKKIKVVNDIDWSRYKAKGDPPLVIVSHICSTRIPYKTAGKENVADRQEIEKELRLTIQFLARKLSVFMNKRGQAEAARKRANLYAKYVPLIAQFCTELAGKKKEPQYQKILQEEKPIENE